MAVRDPVPDSRGARAGRRGVVSEAVDLIRRGETVLALIDPAARGRDPEAFSRWLSARLTIAELPRLMLPDCDARCEGVRHDADACVVLSDLALDAAEPRPPGWWGSWNGTLERQHQSRGVWYAGAPAMPLTRTDRRLATGTHLRRVASTDPHLVVYDGAPLEILYRIADGPFEGDSLIVVSFGPAALLPAVSGTLVAPDHPPARDPKVVVSLLAAGWAAVERGLPFEE